MATPVPVHISSKPKSTLVPHAVMSAPTAHTLKTPWVLWVHNVKDTGWDLRNYTQLATYSTAEEVISLTRSLNEHIVRTCMLFVMRKGIAPMWEDSKNRNGGTFSYKVRHENVFSTWCMLMRALAGESVGESDPSFSSHITGASISAKRGFSIIKIWMDCRTYQDPRVIGNIGGIAPDGCLFKNTGT